MRRWAEAGETRAADTRRTKEGEMMRSILCLIPLLCACSAPRVRCDAHLEPINPPAARDTPKAAIQASPVRRAP
jgi:hypothetical protein